MRFHLKLLFAASLFAAMLPAHARAQQCRIFEQILTPRNPVFGVPAVWDTRYGGRDAVLQVTGAVPLEGGTVMISGRRLDLKTRAPTETFLAEINNRGRALIETSRPAKKDESPVTMIASNKNLITLSSIKAGKGNGETQTRLAWYKRDGSFVRERMFRADGYNYEAMSVIDAGGSSGTLVALHAVSRKNPEGDQYSILLRLKDDGSLMWKRAYRPGSANKFVKLIETSDKNYLAVGDLTLDDGRKAGWAVKLTPKGEIFWQRAYPRGKSSSFKDAVAWTVPGEEPGYFALIGNVAPGDGTPTSAWVMTINGSGEPQWQRYFHRDDTSIKGAFIRRDPDGRLTAVVNVDGVGKDIGNGAYPDHIRVFTLSASGTFINDEPYLDGLAARAVALGTGAAGERIIAATISADAQPEDKEAAAAPEKIAPAAAPAEKPAAEKPSEGAVPETAKPEDKALAEKLPPVEKGWLLAAVPLPPYNDPCQPKLISTDIEP